MKKIVFTEHEVKFYSLFRLMVMCKIDNMSQIKTMLWRFACGLDNGELKRIGNYRGHTHRTHLYYAQKKMRNSPVGKKILDELKNNR